MTEEIVRQARRRREANAMARATLEAEQNFERLGGLSFPSGSESEESAEAA